MRKRKRATLGRGLALAAAIGLLSAGAAEAQIGFAGEKFISNGGEVTVKYDGSIAAYFNALQWFTGGWADVDFNLDGTVDYNTTAATNLFYNKTVSNVWTTDGMQNVTQDPTGTVKSLGNIAYGTEVLFGLFVHNELGDELDDTVKNPDWEVRDSDDYTYFSGPLARNVDNTFHLSIVDLGAGTFQFQGGWEDIENGGDQDYNDFIFEVSGVHVTPEPASMLLMATGLFGMAGVAMRRRRNQDDAV